MTPARKKGLILTFLATVSLLYLYTLKDKQLLFNVNYFERLTSSRNKLPQSYVWTPLNSTPSYGKDFNISSSLLESIGFPLHNFITLPSDNQALMEFVFVTAGSVYFTGGLYNLIHSVQIHFPTIQIIVYDIGLKAEDSKKIGKLCNVKIKKFNFGLFPKHVKTLHNYAWKPLIIHEELKTHSGIFWLDSPVVINTNSTISQLFTVVRRTNGISLMLPTGHSTYAVTHPQLYQYIPSNTSTLMHTMQYCGGLLLIYRTEEIYTHVLSWWVLCSLQVKCAQPTMERSCFFWPTKLTEWARCHRYDQTSLNILLANYFNFNDSVYYSDQDKSGMLVIRGRHKVSSPIIC